MTHLDHSNLAHGDLGQGDLSQSSIQRNPEAALEQAQHLYRQAVRASDFAGMAQSRIHGGYAQIYLGQYQLAKLFLSEANQLAQKIGAQALQAHALSGLGAAFAQSGHYGEALQYQLESLRLVQQLGDRQGEARALNIIGYLYIYLRDCSQAQRYHADAYELASHIDDSALAASAAINLAVCYENSGQAEAALNLNRKTLATVTKKGFSQQEAILQGNIASNLTLLG